MASLAIRPGLVMLCVFLTLAVVAQARPARVATSQRLLGAIPMLLGLVAGLSGPTAGPRPTDSNRPPERSRSPLVLEGTVVGPPRALRSRPRPGSRAADPRVRFVLEGHIVPAKFDNGGKPRVAGNETRISAVVPGDPAICRGDRVRVTGRLVGDPPILVVRNARHLERLDRATGPLSRCDQIRRDLRREWFSRWTPSTAAWLSALFLGERRMLDDRVPVLFRRIGQSHLIAISGLHVGIVASVLLIPLRRLRTGRRRWLGVLVALCILGYAGLAGGDAPVMRAAVLGLVGAVAATNGRPSDLLNATALALLLLGAWSGDTADRASFVLSFSAVVGIAVFRPSSRQLGSQDNGVRLARWRSKLWRALLASLRVSLAAWAGVSIALVWWTPDFVPGAPLFTLVLVPLITLLLLLAALCAVICLLPPTPVDELLGALLRGLISLLETVARACDTLPGTPWSWPTAEPLTLSLALAAGLVLFLPRPQRPGQRGRASAALLVLCIVTAAVPAPAHGVALLPMGRGQAVTSWSHSAVVLYDAGSLDRVEGGSDVIRRQLRATGRTHIDVVVLSHPHLDHVNAVVPLLRRISIGTVLVGPRFEEASLGRSVLAYLEREGVRVEVVARGDHVQVGDTSLQILHPPLSRRGAVSLNDDSLVVLLRREGLKLLLTGDLEARGAAEVPIPLEGLTVVLPHHGRFHRGLETWLRRGRPARLLASTPTRGFQPRMNALLERLDLPTHGTAGRTLQLTPSHTAWAVRRE